MDKKNVLIVSRSFHPLNSPRSFRTTELVKEFARQGHSVTLLTPKQDRFHIPFEEKHGVVIKNLGKPKFKRFDLSNKNKITRLGARILNRGLNLLIEYPDIEWMVKVKKALKQEAGYDLLISIAAPHPVHWGVAWAWREKDPIAKTWIADCGDPYMLTVLDSFNKLFYFKYVEKAFCRKADYITVPIESAKEGYYPEFRDKIRVIPQGFDFDEIDIDHDGYRKHPVPTFAYAGALIPGGRDPSEFLAYLESLDREYQFIVYTKNRSLVEPYAKASNRRIEIRDYIPREELLQILSRMDFLVNIENNTALQQPSKLIDYYLAGRPVLSVKGQDIDKQKVDQFLEGDYSKCYSFNNVGRYRIENVCSQFLALSKQSGP